MEKLNGFLIAIIFLLIFVITGLCCWGYQQKMNEQIMMNRLTTEIQSLKEKNESQDRVINNLICTQAAHGWFDKKGE